MHTPFPFALSKERLNDLPSIAIVFPFLSNFIPFIQFINAFWKGGRIAKDVCREYRVSPATYYKWKSKYGGMEASDIRRIKELEAENRKLKQMFADLSLEHMALKDVIEKKL